MEALYQFRGLLENNFENLLNFRNFWAIFWAVDVRIRRF
jgi:hypothetical protein